VYLIIAGFLAWILVMIGIVWAPQKESKDQKITHPLVLMFRGIGLMVLSYWSLIFIDSFIKFVFLNQMSDAATKFSLFTIVLGLISAVILLIGAVFTAPTKKSLLTFVAVVGVYIYFFWGNGYLDLEEKDALYIPLIYTLASQVAIFIVISLIQLLRKKSIHEDPLWDKKARFEPLLQPKVTFAFFLLYMILLFELFAGFSPFAYGPGATTYTQVFLDILMIAGFALWWLVDKKRVHSP